MRRNDMIATQDTLFVAVRRGTRGHGVEERAGELTWRGC
jgi:hypothetical protein